MNEHSTKFMMASNFITFQVAWFVLAYWHNQYAAFTAMVLLAWLCYSERWPAMRIKLTVQIASIGLLVDSGLVYAGFIGFDADVLPIPFWFVMLWALFACTCSMSLSWLINKPFAATLAGAIFGPLSYWAGMQFEALSISGGNGLMAVSVAWAMMMWLFSFLYRNSKRFIVPDAQVIQS